MQYSNLLNLNDPHHYTKPSKILKQVTVQITEVNYLFQLVIKINLHLSQIKNHKI
jgi:hypothetical protein